MDLRADIQHAKNKTRNAERFLDYLDTVDIPGMHSLLVGVVHGQDRADFFKESWPLVERRWKHAPKFLGETASVSLVSAALRDPRDTPLLEHVLDNTQKSAERTALLAGKWISSTTFSALNWNNIEGVLDLILRQYGPDELAGGLDTLLDDACRQIQMLDVVKLREGRGQKTIHHLITAGASFYRISRNQYPNAWEMAQQHPRVVAARLGEIAGMATENTVSSAAPKRSM